METRRKTTIAGTDIEEVKRLNARSGLTYNEAKLILAQSYRAKKRMN
ncbi:hypothetical protein M3212_05135 [Alkalihalobacillus oceani]|nr:hypothetical protein [Halalkalibacter oceani]MCM3760172.1 hypothetical protein [Halalkalibacter oceani]